MCNSYPIVDFSDLTVVQRFDLDEFTLVISDGKVYQVNVVCKAQLVPDDKLMRLKSFLDAYFSANKEDA